MPLCPHPSALWIYFSSRGKIKETPSLVQDLHGGDLFFQRTKEYPAAVTNTTGNRRDYPEVRAETPRPPACRWYREPGAWRPPRSLTAAEVSVLARSGLFLSAARPPANTENKPCDRPDFSYPAVRCSKRDREKPAGSCCSEAFRRHRRPAGTSLGGSRSCRAAKRWQFSLCDRAELHGKTLL
ncbi:Protein Fam87A [Manis pentadactyla]|nr:Protein Fam87A [Manis pentadactyla]